MHDSMNWYQNELEVWLGVLYISITIGILEVLLTYFKAYTHFTHMFTITCNEYLTIL